MMLSILNLLPMPDVIKIIRLGLQQAIDQNISIDPAIMSRLMTWCDEMEDYVLDEEFGTDEYFDRMNER